MWNSRCVFSSFALSLSPLHADQLFFSFLQFTIHLIIVTGAFICLPLFLSSPLTFSPSSLTLMVDLSRKHFRIRECWEMKKQIIPIIHQYLMVCTSLTLNQFTSPSQLTVIFDWKRRSRGHSHIDYAPEAMSLSPSLLTNWIMSTCLSAFVCERVCACVWSLVHSTLSDDWELLSKFSRFTRFAWKLLLSSFSNLRCAYIATRSLEQCVKVKRVLQVELFSSHENWKWREKGGEKN